jgi:hypothetical protein
MVSGNPCGMPSASVWNERSAWPKSPNCRCRNDSSLSQRADRLRTGSGLSQQLSELTERTPRPRLDFAYTAPMSERPTIRSTCGLSHRRWARLWSKRVLSGGGRRQQMQLQVPGNREILSRLRYPDDWQIYNRRPRTDRNNRRTDLARPSRAST